MKISEFFDCELGGTTRNLNGYYHFKLHEESKNKFNKTFRDKSRACGGISISTDLLDFKFEKDHCYIMLIERGCIVSVHYNTTMKLIINIP